MESFSLKDRVALITGGAGGIGISVARQLAEAGAHIALADIRDDAVMQAAQDLTGLGYRAIGLAADVSNPADTESLLRRTLKAFKSASYDFSK